MVNWSPFFDYPPRADILVAVVIWTSALYIFLRIYMSSYRLAFIATVLSLFSAFIYRLWTQSGYVSLDSLLTMIMSTYFGQILEYYVIALLITKLISSVFKGSNRKGIFKGR